ncbi:hypothetical protein HOY82DRAFT_527450 [Tuber indicum]|nr:hypothetical protein HOY82DRAFT_527450 [Tuber indicum]
MKLPKYNNMYIEKYHILKENRGKSGIYMFTNKINKKRYIGSSQNLTKRFYEYFNTNYLLKCNYMAICCALLKHDYFNFSLTILEYCSPDKCLIREKYYWGILNPEYNLAKDPTAPMSGRTHSDATKKIMSDIKKGTTLDEETKFKISDAHKGKTLDDKTKIKISNTRKGQAKPEGSGRPSHQIEVFDYKNNTTTSYDSMGEAARALDIQ